MPTLSLQPLVENAITHGVAPRLDGGSVAVSAQRSAAALQITVEDDGDGFEPGWTPGTGLGNLRQRLESLYGGRASLVITEGPGARVTMTVPMKRG